MSQLPNQAVPVRTGAGIPNAPDILFLLRRYIWLLIAGALIGTMIGGGLYAWLRKTDPKYTASVIFQVLASQKNPAASGWSDEQTASASDINRFVKRQVQYILGSSSNVVSRALLVDEFTSSQWLRDNAADSKAALRNAIEVASIPLSDLFTLSFTCSNPREAKILVDALAAIYQNNLRSDNNIFNTSRMEELSKSMEKQRAIVLNLEQRLSDFRKARDLDALGARRAIQIKVLDELNIRVLEAQAVETALKNNLENIRQQVSDGTFTLPSDEEMRVEHDPHLQRLLASKLSLEQEYEVAIQTVGTSGVVIKNLRTRLEVNSKHAAERREKLASEAAARVQAGAESSYRTALSRLQYYDNARKAKNAEIQDMDVWLLQAKRMEEDISAQKEILTGIVKNVAEQDLRRNTDDTRIRQFSGQAVVPNDPSSPLWYKFWVPGGFFIGLGLTFSLIYLFEMTNTRVRSPMDLTRTLQLPMLGFVPDQQDDAAVTGDLSTAIRTSPNSMIAESFRQIRGRLISQADGTPVKTLLVASIAPGGGATTIASNIANGMVLNEMRVLLIDANFYRPGLEGIYKGLPGAGLADVVANPSLIEEAILESDQMPGLYVMGPGTITRGTASELLESRAFREALDKFKASYDMIIFDGAPLSLVSDSITLGGRVDGVIAVVRAGVTRGAVARVREQLRHARARLLGVILNAAQVHGAGYFKENYRTFYEYSSKGKRTTSVN